MLSECNLPMLAWRMIVHCLCLLYILYKGQGPPSLSELLSATVQARKEIVLRSSHSFRFPFASSSRHLSSFLCFSIRLWNTLLASAISQSRSVSSFMSFLHSFYKADKFSLGLLLSVLNWCICLSFFLSVLTFPRRFSFEFFLFFFLYLFFLFVFLSFLLSCFFCTTEESPPISPLLLDNPLKIYHNNNNNNNNNNNKAYLGWMGDKYLPLPPPWLGYG